MIQLRYNDKNSYDDFGLVVKSVDRQLLPTMIRNEISIPGRNGSWDFENNTYENRIITVEFKFVGKTFEELRSKARDIALWLGRMEYRKLVFSDEPDKYYMAKIYDSIGLSNTLRQGQGAIKFECQPFAFNLNEDITAATITISGQKINVELNGTAETPEVIKITNLGSNISTIKLELESLKL